MSPWKYGAAELKLLRDLHGMLSGQFSLANPFVPYVGAAFASAPVRVMVLGKATEGAWTYGAERGYCDVERAGRFVRESVAISGYRSPFWRFMADVVGEAHQAANAVSDDGSARWALDRVVWTNVFKLGQSTGGAPSRRLAAAQLPLMKELLDKELAEWKPTAVVATVGDSYGDHMRVLFGATDWEENENPIAGENLWAKTIQPGMRLYWMRHPQGAKRHVLAAICARIAKDQAALMSVGSSTRIR